MRSCFLKKICCMQGSNLRPLRSRPYVLTIRPPERYTSGDLILYLSTRIDLNSVYRNFQLYSGKIWWILSQNFVYFIISLFFFELNWTNFVDYLIQPPKYYPENVIRPNIGCRGLVKRNIIKIAPGIANELMSWQEDVRLRCAQLLCAIGKVYE